MACYMNVPDFLVYQTLLLQLLRQIDEYLFNCLTFNIIKHI